MSSAEMEVLLRLAYGERVWLRDWVVSLNPATNVAESEITLACDRYEPAFLHTMPSAIYDHALRVTWIDREGNETIWHGGSLPHIGHQTSPAFDAAKALAVLVAAEAEFNGSNLTA